MNIRNILAAGLVGLMVASCADNTCHIEGVVESAQAGDTLLFARMENDTFVPTDTVILEEGGKFSMDKPCDPTVIASYFFFNKQSQEAYSNVFFIEKGKVSMRIGTDGNVSGTENNDIYQELSDSIFGIHEKMNELYAQQAQAYARSVPSRTRRGKPTDCIGTTSQPVIGRKRAETHRQAVGLFLVALML